MNRHARIHCVCRCTGVEKPTPTRLEDALGDGWVKGRNKKSRSHRGDDVVVVVVDDDDRVSGSRLVDADVPAPGVLSSGFFSATKCREKRRKRGKVLPRNPRCFAVFYLSPSPSPLSIPQRKGKDDKSNCCSTVITMVLRMNSSLIIFCEFIL